KMAQRIIAPTSKAGTFTLDQYIGQGWTLDQLLEHGYFVDRTPAPKPSNEFKPANKAPEGQVIGIRGHGEPPKDITERTTAPNVFGVTKLSEITELWRERVKLDDRSKWPGGWTM